MAVCTTKGVPMAKKKEDYLKEAQALGLAVTEKNTVAEIQAALKSATESQENSNLTTGNSKDNQEFAKAGKRSKKSVEEAEALKEKEERKAKIAAGEVDPSAEAPTRRGPVPKTRPLIERRGKKYRQAAEKIDKAKQYSLGEACQLAIDTSTTSFDATIELHVRLNVDPTQADQNVRGTTALPHGTGKTVRIAVFAPSDQHEAAKKAGANIVGEDDFLEQLKKEQIDFDVLISIPQLMAQLGRFAKLLGPKGLMPNPKSGTVTKNVAQAVEEAKAGKVEFRIDKQGIVHLGIGKVSFGGQKVTQNATTVLAAIKSARPASLKGPYIEKISLTTSMGPSVSVDLSDLSKIV